MQIHWIKIMNTIGQTAKLKNLIPYSLWIWICLFWKLLLRNWYTEIINKYWADDISNIICDVLHIQVSRKSSIIHLKYYPRCNLYSNYNFKCISPNSSDRFRWGGSSLTDVKLPASPVVENAYVRSLVTMAKCVRSLLSTATMSR